MAKHKAPAEVTVAPLFEKSALERTFDKYKVPAAAVVLAIVAWVIFSYFNQREAQRQLDQSWEAVIAQTTPDPLTRLPSSSPEQLAGLASQLKDRHSGPWVRLLEVQKRILDDDLSGALAAIETLRTEHPDHMLVTEQFQLAGQGQLAGEAAESGILDAEPTSIVDHLARVLRDRQEWEAQHPSLFTNPPPPEGSPRVQLQTSSGVIEVALYAEEAPQHVANFLKLCEDGYYDKTKIHRVVKGFMIQGGDPNSVEGDPSTWGQGGPDYTIPGESNDLSHFAGVLSAAKKPGDTESSGSQFFITTDPALRLDGQHTIFGSVVAGQEVVSVIASGALEPGTADRPMAPVTIESAKLLE